jgi:hypothetical protein
MTTNRRTQTHLPSQPSQWVPLHAIRSNTIAVRVSGVDDAWVERLCDRYLALPPILVTQNLEIIDGHHRFRAASDLGLTEIRVERHRVVDEFDRLRLAVHANSEHGLHLSRADVTYQVRLVLRLQRNWSDRRIAELLTVSPTTVGKYRKERDREEALTAGVHPGQPATPAVQIGHEDTCLCRDGRLRARRTQAEAPGEATPVAPPQLTLLRWLLNRIGRSVAAAWQALRRHGSRTAVVQGDSKR